MNFIESQTRKNLAKAFAAECQAGARYQFMATQAQNEKLFFIKDTMKMLAKNEMAHAKLFYDYIVENSGKDSIVEFEADYSYLESKLCISLLKEAEIEKHEFDEIYPTFAEVARQEGYKEIAQSFELVANVENSHARILEHLNKLYSNGKMYESKEKSVFRCTNCGHLAYLNVGWKTCPLCSLDQGYIALDFSKIFEDSVRSQTDLQTN